MNLNKVFVLGNLTRDPERKNLPSGQPVANFGIATNRFYTDKDGQKQQLVEFHNIVAFGKLAETAHQYLRKGSLVLIEGRLRTSNWQDASSGTKRYRTEIITERMQLGPRTAARTTTEFQPVNSPETQVKNAVSDEEIPVIEEESTSSEETKEDPRKNSPEDKPSSTKKPQASSTEKPSEDKDQDDQEIDVSQIPF